MIASVDKILDELEEYYRIETRQPGDFTMADVRERHPNWSKHMVTRWIEGLMERGLVEKIPKDENDTGMNLYRPVKDSDNGRV